MSNVTKSFRPVCHVSKSIIAGKPSILGDVDKNELHSWRKHDKKYRKLIKRSTLVPFINDVFGRRFFTTVYLLRFSVSSFLKCFLLRSLAKRYSRCMRNPDSPPPQVTQQKLLRQQRRKEIFFFDIVTEKESVFFFAEGNCFIFFWKKICCLFKKNISFIHLLFLGRRKSIYIEILYLFQYLLLISLCYQQRKKPQFKVA